MSRLVSLRRRWYQLLRAAPFLLVVALLPSLLYLDHWIEYLNYQPGQPPLSGDTGDVERVSHDAHCHFGPSTCSEQPVPPNLRAFPNLIELPEPELPTVLLEDSATTLEEFIASPQTEPPRSL